MYSDDLNNCFFLNIELIVAIDFILETVGRMIDSGMSLQALPIKMLHVCSVSRCTIFNNSYHVALPGD